MGMLHDQPDERPSGHPSPEARAALRLRLAPGVGPVLIERLTERFGSCAAAVGAIEAHGAAALADLDRVGKETARRVAAAIPGTDAAADAELAELSRLGARLVARTDPGYPPLLRDIPAAPPTISVRGTLEPERDRFAVAIVGSRKSTAYGAEQAGRFAAALGAAGLTVVSGGARGIDTHAHAAALRAGARCVVVLGCGLTHCYPPENRDLFESIVERGGAVISELPTSTAPEARNFPARNRIISGVALGTLVVEAGKKSGALITARQAAEEQGREVLAVPGRVDSPASEGCLELIRAGAALALSPADVLEALETPARHAHADTHASRYQSDATPADPAPAAPPIPTDLTDHQRTICEALAQPRTLDELARATDIAAETLRAETTMLELRRVLVREGARLRLARAR